MSKKVILGILLLTILLGINYFVKNNEQEKNKNIETCKFIRTYKILNVAESNDINYIYLTIRAFQDEEVQTIKVKRKLISNPEEEYYEFTFKTKKKIKASSILSIYNNSKIVSITKTTKTGLEQINEKVNCNKNKN